jgi:hypothetical protein
VSGLGVGGCGQDKPAETLEAIAPSAPVHFEQHGPTAEDAVFKFAQQGVVAGSCVKMQRGRLGSPTGVLGCMGGTEMGEVTVSRDAGSLQSGQSVSSRAMTSSKSCDGPLRHFVF